LNGAAENEARAAPTLIRTELRPQREPIDESKRRAEL